MEPHKIRGTTQRLVSRTGAGKQGNTSPSSRGEKNVLDISSYRTGDSTSVRRLFALVPVVPSKRHSPLKAGRFPGPRAHQSKIPNQPKKFWRG